jgi:glyoxylase-like metal-dependent hydrolase (beta-lactamase superfamily II)
MSLNTSPDSGAHWTEPGAWQVVPGIHRIPLPLPMDGLQAVNVYTIETEDGLTLIDGGWALEVSRRALIDALQGIGRSLQDIRAFLVTHAHRDHYTQAVTLRAEVGAHVSLGVGERATLERIHEFTGGVSPFVPLLERAGAHDLAVQWAAHDHHDVRLEQWQFPDAWLESDQPIVTGNLTAVSTPGHTRGHFVFSDTANGLLFAGDHVLPTITPSIGFEGDPPDQPLGDFLSSLAKVRAMPDLSVLPAHGPVGMSSHQRVDELLEHHEHRLALCLDVVRAGERTAYEVATQLPWTRRNRAFRDLDPFNAALATMETRVHLLLLIARGQVTASDVDGQDVYRLA